MVPLKIQFIATICLITEAYSQYPQRCGPTTAPSTGCIIPGPQFVVPAIIKPLLPVSPPSAAAQPALCTPNKQAPVASCCPPACTDNDDDGELDRLLYLLICNIIENRRNCGKKQSCASTVCDSNVSLGSGSNDGYESCPYGYGDDFDYGAPPSTYSTPMGYGSGKDSVYTVPLCDNTIPEIVIVVKCPE